ncbi:MAG: hypothetical protein ABFS45_21165 [Pseudomonadota bacterium]
MTKYKLRFLEPQYTQTQQQQRQETLAEIDAFIRSMYGRTLAIVTLDDTQSTQWDQVGEFDYQDYFGQEIINQVSNGTTQTLIIRNDKGLPVALASRNPQGQWRGLEIIEPLRQEVLSMINFQEQELS